jgi:glycosyltransferase involved in cell wall biosynthesis
MSSLVSDWSVSVIIPCYNQADCIAETIHSVMKSTRLPQEIIVVDDGSTDDSVLVLKDLNQQYPIIQIFQQANRGPSVARNFAIRQAKGALILPLDGDDLIADNYIEEAVKAFAKDPSLKVVYCEAEKFGAKQGRWKLKPFSLENLAMDNMIFVSAFFRKSDWEQCGGFPEDLRWVSEDWVFWIAMLKNGGKVLKLPLVGFYYRIQAGSRRKGMTRQKKQVLIDYINKNHSEFVYKYLNGPLRYQRHQSKRWNNFLRLFGCLKGL